MAGTTYYVSGTGNDNSNGLTTTTPFRSIGRAIWQFKTGDTILVMNGTYEKVGLIFNKNGSPNKWTTIKAYPGATPKIITTVDGINIFSSSYVRIEGLDITGNRANVTLDYALKQKNNLSDPLTTANGIMIRDWKNAQGEGGTNSHHIVITGNTIRNFPSVGIGCANCDYLTVEKNIVSGNAWYSPYGAQGISFQSSFNLDNNTTDYRMIIRENVVYDNKSLIPVYSTGINSEGHGIMLDTVGLTQGLIIPYTGKSLIANNITYNNGNSGISVFKSNNADVINNTTYQNSRVLSGGEIGVAYADNVRVYNNILYASDNQSANYIKYATNVTFDHNLVYNSNVFQASNNPNATGIINILGKDPQFVDASTNNFTLKSNSPAINAGANIFNNITGNSGTGSPVTLGAYIHVGAYQAPSLQIQALNGTVDIADGSSSMINFGDTIVGKNLISKTFTIKNTSTPALNLSNLQLIDEFSLVGNLPTSPALLTSSAIVLLIILAQNMFRALKK
ncbi:MAG: DUF1565 domain-containing protein [Nostoc sp.]